MGKRTSWRNIVVAALAFVGIFGSTVPVFAVTSSSSHYKVEETGFSSGTSTAPQSCSGSYCAKVSLGNLDTGSASNGTTTAAFGPITEDTPSLEVIVDPGVSDVGNLTTEHTATKTMIVSIRSYQSNGYVLQVSGNPPQYAGHTLHTDASPTASTAGTEQFGINSAANTAPSVGAGAVQVPSGSFSFGQVNSDYSQPNKFMYVSGADIGHSSTASGQTSYTISMVINISNSTPAGRYTSDFSAVVIPVY